MEWINGETVNDVVQRLNLSEEKGWPTKNISRCSHSFSHTRACCAVDHLKGQAIAAKIGLVTARDLNVFDFCMT